MGMIAAKLCGRDMIHLTPRQPQRLDLQALAAHLPQSLQTKASEDLLYARTPEAEIYLFPDGRAFVKGISDPDRARTIYNRYISP
jgi:adenylyltransferase/sulfurtransferase